MKTNPCLVIPVYNQAPLFREFLPQLKAQGIPLVLVDDGSNDGTSEIIATESEQSDTIIGVHLTANSGKGAAVTAGFDAAIQHGFTHAVQVDADGQHDLTALLPLLEAMKKDPEALILGVPQFGASAPTARVWGRKLTTFMLWLETLRFDIQDGLCGFRVYPLDFALPLARQCRKRMDFDPEILIRWAWEGWPVRNVPVSVKYHVNGISHFRYFQDNVAMVFLHVRMLSELLRRLLFSGSLRHNKKDTPAASQCDSSMPR